jgi:hypothetical protein
MNRARRNSDFEWTFSTRVRERQCRQCSAMTSGYLTDLGTGVRKPLCSTCFFSAMREAAPSSAPLIPTKNEMEQLTLC